MTAPDRVAADTRTRTIPVFRNGGWYDSLDTATLPGDGDWRLSLVPRAIITADARRPQGPPAPLDGARRLRIAHDALDLFDNGTLTVGSIGTQGAQDFRQAMTSLAGLPQPLTEQWMALLREGLPTAPPHRPLVGRTLVSLPANTFTCLISVIDAVLDSETIWIRPSRREPLSAARMVAALLSAGWPADRLAFYPTAPEVLPALIKMTDRQVVYGGDGIAGRFAGLPTLTLHGPGRGCALIPKGRDPQAAVDWLVPLIAGNSGRFCKNVRAVLCADAPEPIAHALGTLLDTIRIHPADNRWPQAAIPAPAMAPRIAQLAHELVGPRDRMITTRPLLQRHGARTFLAPTLVQLGDPGNAHTPHPLLGRELPFPFAAICRPGTGLTEAIQRRSLFIHTMPDGPSGEGTAA